MKQSVDVHNFLKNKDVPHEFFIMETAAKTTEQTAAILGLRPKEVVKSVILFIDKKPTIAIIPSSKKISLEKIKKAFSKSDIVLASSKTAVKTTGYILNATPPVAHETFCKTIVDESCMKLNVLYTIGGEMNAMLKIRPKDLIKLTSAKILDITK